MHQQCAVEDGHAIKTKEMRVWLPPAHQRSGSGDARSNLCMAILLPVGDRVLNAVHYAADRFAQVLATEARLRQHPTRDFVGDYVQNGDLPRLQWICVHWAENQGARIERPPVVGRQSGEGEEAAKRRLRQTAVAQPTQSMSIEMNRLSSSSWHSDDSQNAQPWTGSSWMLE